MYHPLILSIGNFRAVGQAELYNVNFNKKTHVNLPFVVLKA